MPEAFLLRAHEAIECTNKSKPAIVLIMGLRTQMISWPEVFCAGLADRGFRVIRFDDRDIGLPTSAMRRRSPPVRAISANRHRRDRQQFRPTHLDKSH
jgi:pimeloyl-ACP methyl ester carboxylesterase